MGEYNLISFKPDKTKPFGMIESLKSSCLSIRNILYFILIVLTLTLSAIKFIFRKQYLSIINNWFQAEGMGKMGGNDFNKLMKCDDVRFKKTNESYQ